MTLSLVRRAAVGLAVGLLATSGFAANVLSLKEKVEVTAPPQKVWELIKDFDGWQNWHPAVASTEITSGKGNTHGTVRVLTTKDGAKITERLDRYQPKIFSYVPDHGQPAAGHGLCLDAPGEGHQVRIGRDLELAFQGQGRHSRRRCPQDDARYLHRRAEQPER
jgi:hypothetical protein